MGAAASIEGKHWGREVSPSQIHKSEMSFDRTGQERKGSPFFDILIHEMRFDAIWHAQSELPEFQEEDLGKELREINKEDTLRYCEEFSMVINFVFILSLFNLSYHKKRSPSIWKESMGCYT